MLKSRSFSKKKCEERKHPSKKKKKGSYKKSKKKRLSKRYTSGRRISLKNSLSKKKGKNVDQAIQKAKKMSDDSIKDELFKSGIIIKGNQKQLMRDIYVFSNLGGINIKKE